MRMTREELRKRFRKADDYIENITYYPLDIVFVSMDFLGLFAFISFPWNDYKYQYDFFRYEFRDVPKLNITVPKVVSIKADHLYVYGFTDLDLPDEFEVLGWAEAEVHPGIKGSDKFPVLIIKLPEGWEPDTDRYFIYDPEGRIIR